MMLLKNKLLIRTKFIKNCGQEDIYVERSGQILHSTGMEGIEDEIETDEYYIELKTKYTNIRNVW